jgi:YHS domain-containing protein
VDFPESHLKRRGAVNRVSSIPLTKFQTRPKSIAGAIQEQVKSLSRIVQVILWGILLNWLLRMMQRWISSAARGQASEPRRSADSAPIVLRRDPCCGTYVSPEISFSVEQAGQIEHFCSAECRDRFLRSGRCLRGLQVQPTADRTSA